MITEEKRKTNIYTVQIEAFVRELSTSGLNEQAFHEVNKLIPDVAELLAEYNVPAEKLTFDQGSNIDSLLLTFSVAAHEVSNQPVTGEIYQDAIIPLIWGINPWSDEKPNLHGDIIDEDTLLEIVNFAYEGSYDFVAFTNPLEMWKFFELQADLTDNRVVAMPISYWEDFFLKATTQNTYPPFLALCIKEHNLVLCFSDTDMKTQIHERNHLESDIISVGSAGFGAALNEGLTEYLTFKELEARAITGTYYSSSGELIRDKPLDDGIDYVERYITGNWKPFDGTRQPKSSYNDELRLVHTLFDNVPELKPIMIEMYRCKTPDNTLKFFSVLSNSIGLKAIIDLYLAQPNRGYLDERISNITKRTTDVIETLFEQ